MREVKVTITYTLSNWKDAHRVANKAKKFNPTRITIAEGDQKEVWEPPD